MNPISDPSPFPLRSRLNRPDKDAHLRDVARRRWFVQQERERRQERQQSGQQGDSQNAKQAEDRVGFLRELMPGRTLGRSLSPVYSLFNERFLARR